MMITPCRRRSFQDHREYYNNVAPKVDSRWPEGTPLSRRRKLNRRKTDSFVLEPEQKALIKSSSADKIAEDVEEVFEDSLSITDKDISQTSLHNISSFHMQVVNDHFKELFTQLEDFAKGNARTDIEKAFVECQIRILKDQASQIDYMISELTERGERLEKFLQNRHNNNDWYEWKN